MRTENDAREQKHPYILQASVVGTGGQPDNTTPRHANKLPSQGPLLSLEVAGRDKSDPVHRSEMTPYTRATDEKRERKRKEGLGASQHLEDR